jgi:hypothetical protein
VDEVSNQKLFASAPYAGSGIEGQGFLFGLCAAGLGFTAGNDLAGEVLEFHFLKLPYFTLALAETGFVLE